MNISTIIRPSARHILTIGEGLIKDRHTALVELVKNAYDADATLVTITFKESGEGENRELKIFIQDDGWGMSLEDVLTKWLVPSTDNKAKNPKSKSGLREVQGKKGIGRYASSILGYDLLMTTISNQSGEKTTIYLDWKLFENPKYKYLDEVPIEVESMSKLGDENSGTYLEICTKNAWSSDELEALKLELRRLVLPFEKEEEDRFNIELSINDTTEIIEPFPLMEHYHYRILGSMKPILENGKEKIILEAIYENFYDVNNKIELNKTITFDGKKFGEVKFDIRACDLEKNGKDNLRARNVNAVKEWEYFRGVSIFRGDFRIRPYGDSNFDWLGLDMRRVNNPSFNLSNNQILGIIRAENEDVSGLEEKASREGLKENEAYQSLIKGIIQAITLLERERYYFRQEMKKSKENSKLGILEELHKTPDLSLLTAKVVKTLKRSGATEETIQNIVKRIQYAQKQKQNKANQIEKAINEERKEQNEITSFLQKQATLGTVLSITIHETTNYVFAIRNSQKSLLKTNDTSRNLFMEVSPIESNKFEDVYKLNQDILNRLGDNNDSIGNLFSRLTPLSGNKRKPKKLISLGHIILNVIHIFENKLKEEGILVDFNVSEDAILNVHEADIMAVIMNLMDNSIYWLKESVKLTKNISIKSTSLDSKIIVDFIDNGMGISKEEIEKGYIFNFAYTTKTNGTGIGLYIAGDSMRRNNGILEAVFFEGGAHFRVTFNQ